MAENNEVAVTGRSEQAIQQYLSPEAERFAMEQRMAKLFVMSGLFVDIKGQNQEQAIAQAYVKIALGNSMGFSPAESMQGIDIIQGKPTVGAQLRAARMQRNGFTWTIDRLDNRGCELTLYQGGRKLGPCSFTEEDAKSSGLIGKDNWKKNPSDMYFARAITRAQRRYAPGVLSLDIMSGEEAINAGDFSVAGEQPQWVEKPHVAIASSKKVDDLKERIEKAKDKRETTPPKPAQEGLEPLEYRQGLPVYAGMPPMEAMADKAKFWVGDKRFYYDAFDQAYRPAPDVLIHKPEEIAAKAGDNF